MGLIEIKVFLASSSELELVRVHIGDFFNDINSILLDTDVRVRLLKWEIFDPSFKGERKQTEYDQQVVKSDVFIVLFRTRAGKFTLEEADVAKASYNENKMPQELYCFIQDWQEKREFDVDELKTNLGSSFKIDAFENINDLKCKIIKILMARFTANSIAVSETDKFIQINSVNILNKTKQD
ncbi:MAG: hypothetical protein FWB95_07390 [Treponema sp.]|nr:hypothetical protein [Treponema sp.]